MNRYPMKPLMDEMATHGRYGDSMLVHMNPAEVQGIASLVPGGQLTVNPVTGQPEAFLPILASLLGSWGGTAALAGTGISSTLAGAIGSGIATTAVTGDIKRGLVSGLIGAGTGGLFEGAAEAADATAGLQELAKDGLSGADIVADAGKLSETISATDPLGNVIDASYVPEATNVFGSSKDIAQMSPVPNVSPMAGQYQDIMSQFPDLKDMTPEQIENLSPAWEGAKSFGSDMMGAKALVPTALGAGQLEQMDMEDQWKAAQMQTELDRQAQLDEARGNLQRGYAAAQPDAMRGPSPYRSYLSSYTPDYEYANAGGVVSLMGGGPVKKYQAGGEFDPEVYAQNLPANVRDIYLKSSADGYDSLTEEEAATLSNYFSAAGAGALGGKGGGINVPQTGTQGGTDTTPQNPVTPALPTSGYMRDPYTGAIVYLGGTRPGAGTPMEPRQQNLGGYMGGKGGMNMMTGGAGNPAYGGIDPVTIQANLRGQYSMTPPSGYALGFEPEFNYFQNDPFNVQVPWRGYYPKAFGPMQSGPYFHSSINMPGYLNQIGDYYKGLAGYPVPEGTSPQVQPPVEPPVEPPVTPPPVVETTPEGGIGGIVVGNYQGGEKPTPQTLTGDELLESYIDERHTDRPIFHYNNKMELIKGVPVVGKMKPGRYYHVMLAHDDAEASFATKKQAMDYLKDYYGQTDADSEQEKQTEDDAAKAKAFAAAEKAKEDARAALAARRPNEADDKPLRSGRGMSVTDSSGKTTYFQKGGDVTLETSLGEVSTPAGGIAEVETEFVKPTQNANTPIPQSDLLMVSQAILGRIDQPDFIINMFITKHGIESFLAIRQQVLASAVGQMPQTQGMVQGQGGGMDDQVMGMIGDQQPVAVSPGEYIVPADVVSGLGDGSSDAGAEELDRMLDNVRRARQGGSTAQPPAINAKRMMP